MRPVIITGIGVVSPIGIGWQLFWQALIEGRSGIRRIQRFDPSPYPCQIGGEIPDAGYAALLDPRKLRSTTHVTRLALAAAELALRDAKLDLSSLDPARLGVSVGTATGGSRDAFEQHAVLLERGARRVNPFIINGTPHHGPGIEVASAIGAQGEQTTFANGCPASLHAIAHGQRLIASGALDVCLAGGAESPLYPMTFAGMSRTQELATRNDEPERACRPFDRDHGGLVLSEGSCFVVLEAAERAAQRQASAYARLGGFGASCDGKGVFNFDPTARAATRAVHRALEDSGLGTSDVDYACAHANSAPAFDRKEALVLKTAFGEWAARLPVSSIKGVLGHPFGASGAFQVAATALALRHQLIPATHNLETPDPECDLLHVIGAPRPAVLRHALITSYGYGGLNAYLVLAAPVS